MKSHHEADEPQATIDFAALWARMAPPDLPVEAVEKIPSLEEHLQRFHPTRAAAMVAGLCTEGRYQANGIRFDWLIRLFLGYGKGNRKPRRSDLSDLLNKALFDAGANRLEDPPEEGFVELVPTSRGNFRIFTGYSEKAAHHTEAVLSAFEGLAANPEKTDALQKAYSLLQLSEALVRRAEASQATTPPTSPQATILLPSDERLQALSKRVHFRRSDLEKLGLSLDDLSFFFLPENLLANLAKFDIGNAPLDWYPLAPTDDGLVVLAPHVMSVAARACLIDRAVGFGVQGSLQHLLLLKQGADVSESAFLDLDPVPVVHMAGQPVRDFTFEISAGRFVHVIQTADGFEDWPHRGFGATTPCPDELVSALRGSISAARDHATSQPGFVEGMTLWLAGGWGSGRGLQEEIGDDDWPLQLLEPGDAAVLGACEDGKLEDIWRLIKIERLMKAAGFEFISANGLLNLFQWWRDTEFALIPPHMTDIAPPYLINFDTNRLLTARIEARQVTDRAVRLHPAWGWVVTSRMDRRELSGPPKPIYVSAAHAKRRILLGCATHGTATWWLRSQTAEEVDLNTEFETWKTALEWACLVMPTMEKKLGENWTEPIEFIVSIAPQPEHGPSGPLGESEVQASLDVRLKGSSIELLVKSDWQWALHSPENNAEIELAARLMEGACLKFGIACDLAELRRTALVAAGSTAYRFRHALQAARIIDRLRGLRLAGRAPYLSKTAGALVKCGSAWEVRKREDGPVIEGKEDCIAFLTAFNARALEKLTSAVRAFDRRELVTACLKAMQGAQGELRNWDNTAPALRAIHGEAQDLENSLEALSNANGVLRSSAIIAEVAAAEALEVGGRSVGRMDLEELQAAALMVFLSGDTLPALYADRIAPTIKISPAGDVLYDHEFHDQTVRSTVTIRHRIERQAAVENYRRRFDREHDPQDVGAELDEALAAEYGVPHSVIREFAGALAYLAGERGEGVFVLKRSALIEQLSGIEGLERIDFAPLIDRFTLKSRSTWSDFPSDATQSDRDISKFDRRYSLIGRPLIALNEADDPELVVAPAVVERSLVHNLQGALSGTLQNNFWSSREMRIFASKAATAAGIQFNDEVARALTSYGLEAWPSALPSRWFNTKKTPEVEQLGDMDALALARSGNVVWVIEAKDLKLCRTLGETCRRLNDYRGVVDSRGRPDALLKHLRRVAYARANAAKLVPTLKLPGPPKICGLVVVKAHQPMNQLHGEYRTDARVVTLDELAAIPWDTGWPIDQG